ncbi:c-type cytochrome [Verrucomicrobium spinosum]|uniref:c-type cytochrome n=1 Tax=Verrucomicrobium spinosum TaxID=2736 RepID=UPI0012E26F6E|nr:c-type cytochrome [Verrucomicrobium spinosum]
MFSFVVLGMGSGRHIYREAALASHKAEVKHRTQEYETALAAFNAQQAAGAGPAKAQTGEQLFASCAACHAPAIRLVGPPLAEIAQIYAAILPASLPGPSAGQETPRLPAHAALCASLGCRSHQDR